MSPPSAIRVEITMSSFHYVSSVLYVFFSVKIMTQYIRISRKKIITYIS